MYRTGGVHRLGERDQKIRCRHTFLLSFLETLITKAMSCFANLISAFCCVCLYCRPRNSRNVLISPNHIETSKGRLCISFLASRLLYCSIRRKRESNGNSAAAYRKNLTCLYEKKVVVAKEVRLHSLPLFLGFSRHSRIHLLP